MNDCRAQPESFPSRGEGVGEGVELGTLINISSKTTEKQALHWNILDFFLLDTLKITIRIENLTRWWTQSGSFFVESRHFFQFSKREGEVFPLLPSCAPVSVAEYASISLNMSKYPCKCLNKLFWLCHGSDYAWLSYMFDRLFKIWIWHGCICRAEYVWLWLRTTQ